ncbi:acid protease [Lentinus tigrinus ALCF2SS1-6]|uniref:Acid protease n=1 Tax=Lentinus tigrinus ALCF2SS1-6 TaxID=1328759 RepID=A0A5C2SJC0_9APHY|nr:acid protease [Lentinus tigrinus ALCF2SS1-6]
MLNYSLLQSLLFASLWAGSAYARSAFNIKAHGTGVRFAASGEPNDIGVTTSNDNLYTVDIVLGGQKFIVNLDTGSTDLWVYAPGKEIKFTNTTDLHAQLHYGVGEVNGTIKFAEVQIGDFTIKNQAFIIATEVKDLDLTDYDGIMGMAFDNTEIYDKIQGAWGTAAADELARAPITSIFAQDTSRPNNFDVQLGRTSELEDIAEGAFIISDHADDFESVTKAPQLPRFVDSHWSIVMDAMLVNGKSFAFNQSRVAGVPSGKTIAVLDSGFSLPQLPGPAVDAIYSSIPGTQYNPSGHEWYTPCNASTNLTFVFGGQEFPVHPLDLAFPVAAPLDINGTGVTNVTVCLNRYQQSTLDDSFDLILGDAFLRNVYASFDYGDYYPGNNTNGLPFVQMLSTTNASTMWQEFQEERAAALAELPPAVDPALVLQALQRLAQKDEDLNNTGMGAAALASDDDSSSNGDSWGKKYGPIVLGLLGANLLVGVVLLAVTVTMCVRGVKGKSVGSRYTPVRFKENADDSERATLTYSD